MLRHIPELEELTKPKVLVVEGNDEVPFFDALFNHLAISGIQIINARSKDRIRSVLKTLRLTPGFPQVNSLGVVRDAETSAVDTIRSLRDALSAAGLTAPQRPLEIAQGNPRVAFLVIPPNSESGALEDLCLQSVNSDPAMPCIDDFFDCVDTRYGRLPLHLSKARIHAFLATRDDPTKRLGEAAQASYWPWDSTAFDQLKQFLVSL